MIYINISLWIIIAIIWIFCSILCGIKQYKACEKWDDEEEEFFFTTMAGAIIFSPLWLLAAIIRQTFVQNWK